MIAIAVNKNCCLEIHRDGRICDTGIPDFWASDSLATATSEGLVRYAQAVRTHENARCLLPDISQAEKDKERGARLLRLAALAHNQDSSVTGGYCFESAGAWLQFLLRSSNAPNALIDCVRYDTAFYSDGLDGASPLQPKSRNGWSNGWDACLPWMASPEHLTIPELELALTIFDWKADKPRFVPWLLTHHRPLLPHIHRFLLRHYAFTLLRAFEAALKEAKLDSPPFRAGELHNVPLRLIGSIVVGAFALLGAGDLFPALAQPGNAVQAVFCILFAGGLLFALWWLLRREVYRHNHGFLEIDSQARPRIRRLFSLTAGVAFGVALVAKVSLLSPELAPPPYRFMTRPEFLEAVKWAALWAVGLLSLTAVSALVGLLIQWIWDDHSGLDTE